MSKRAIKRLIWLLLTAVVTIVVPLTILGIGRVIATVEAGADPASALNIVPNVPPDLHVALEWRPDAPESGREMEPLTRREIEAAYLRAWLQWNLSYRAGRAYGLKSYFVGPARQALDDSIQHATLAGRVSQVDLAHELELHFYSADGSIVALTDHAAQVQHLVWNQEGKLVASEESRSRYDVIMFLEDGNWRIRHLERREAEPPREAAVRPPHADFVWASGTTLIRDGEPFTVRGINYYPSNTPWDLFWPNYDPEEIDADFATMRSLDLNTVRIFIPFAQWGGASVDETWLLRFDDLLEQARRHQLLVIPTLFDFRTDYDPLRWPAADRHLEQILPRYADEPTILAWDLKNEPDLDYPANDRAVVDAWLTHIAARARALTPNHMLTVGWASPETASAIPGVDLLSFHYYGDPDALSERYDALRDAHPDVPLLLGEYGLATAPFPTVLGTRSATRQATHYATILDTLREKDAVGGVAWTLHDFSTVPTTVAGRRPWRRLPQYHMGIIYADGTPKAAARVIGAAGSAPLEGAAPDESRAPTSPLLSLPIVVPPIVLSAGLLRAAWRRHHRSARRG